VNLAWFTPVALTLSARRPGVDVVLTRLKWTAVGGPDAAEGVAVGAEQRVWELLSFLGYYVEAGNVAGTAQWWGKLWRVEISAGGLRCTATLDDLANKVRIAYTAVGSGEITPGTSARTAWASDAASQALYGVRERQDSQRDMTTGEAETRRARLLADMALPRAKYTFSGPSGPAQAKLYFRGLWPTLSWLTYAADVTGASYTSDAVVTADHQKVGETVANAKVAQLVTVTTGRPFYIPKIQLQVSILGSPVDNLRVSTYTNVAGNPGVLLETVDVSPAAFTTVSTWQDALLAGTTAMASGTAFWIVVERSGAIDAANYYIVVSEEALGYLGGNFLIYNSFTGLWGARVPDADMTFQLALTWATGDALADVVEECGQFLAGTDLQCGATGVTTPVYTTGDKDGLTIAQALLADGGSGGQRLLPWVTSQRYLRVEEEPAAPAQPADAPLRVRADGVITTRFGFPVDYPAQVVRRYAFVEAAEPLSRLSQYVQSSGLAFIEAAELDVGTGLVKLAEANLYRYLDLLPGPAANQAADVLAPLL